MADIICPKCAAKDVKVKQSRADKGNDLKYYECGKCRTIWTNSSDIKDLPAQPINK